MALSNTSDGHKEMTATVFPYFDAGQRGVSPPEPIQGKADQCQQWYESGANWSKHHKTFKNQVSGVAP